MSVTDWVFPHLEAKPGAWRRYWVALVAFPDLYRDIFSGSTLEAFCLGLTDAGFKHKMLDRFMRDQARKEKNALKALRKGADVRDIPGSQRAINDLEDRLQELAQLPPEANLERLPFLAAQLSRAVCAYTFSSDLHPRIADRILGNKGRAKADTLAKTWMSLPPLQYLNQRFHPRAQHFRYPTVDRQTRGIVADGGAIERASGQMPTYAAAHAGTNPGTFPFLQSFIGPTPPIPDPESDLGFPDAPLKQFASTWNLFDPDGSQSTDQPFLFQDIPPLSVKRVYQVSSLESWRDLVSRYPLRFTDSEVLEEFRRLSGKEAVFLGVDWERVRRDYDAVFFQFDAVLDCADVGVDIEAEALGTAASSYPGARFVAVMYRVVPGSTLWLNV